MILREIVPILIACSCLSPIAAAQEVFPSPSTIPPSSTVEHTQDFSEVIVPITSVKIIPSVKLGISGNLGAKLDMDADFGTGFCLDAACRFIAKNYPTIFCYGSARRRRYRELPPQCGRASLCQGTGPCHL